MDQVNLQGWIGRTETAQGKLDPEALHNWLLTVSEGDVAQPKLGQAAPQLAHWIAFNPKAGMQDLGPDGHPKLGGFLPPLDLPRRMWAGGALQFHQPLHIGETLSRTSRLVSIDEKTGGTGRMVFVRVDHETHGSNGLAISERQDIVYLPMPERFSPPRPVPAPETVDAERAFSVSTSRLFRYSAVTFNAHRIHYDLPYANDVEKLPGLVVHGPMQATALIHLAKDHAGRAPDHFRFRSIHPMFHTEDLRLLAVEEGDQTLSLVTAGAEQGHVGMQAKANWGEAQ